MPNPILNRRTLRSSSASTVTPYGTLFTQSTWADLTNWTNIGGATFAASSNKINESGGTNLLTDDLYYSPWFTRLEQYQIVRNFTFNSTPGATTYGTGVGTRGINVAYQNVFCKLDCTNTGTQGYLTLYAHDTTNTVVSIATSSTGGVIVSGDSFTMTLLRNGHTITATCLNNTQGWTSTISYTMVLNSGDSTNRALECTGYYSIKAFGGTFNTTSYNVSSAAPQRPNLVLIGNSKAIGSYVGSQSNRFFDQVLLTNAYSGISLSSFGDDVSNEMTWGKQELINLVTLGGANTKVLFCDVPANDIRHGIAAATWKAAYNTLVQTVEDLGCQHFHCMLPEASGGGTDTTAGRDFIVACGWNYIDTWTAMGGYPATASYITADKIHLTLAGSAVVASTLASGVTAVSTNSLDVSAITYFARYAIAPSTTDKRIISNFFRGVKYDHSILPSAALTSLFDAMWLMANPYQDGAKFNLISNSYTLTEVNSPGWVAYQGYTSNGSSSYTNTGILASSVVQQNTSSFGQYLRTNAAVGGQGGAVKTGNVSWFNITPKAADNNMYFAINSNLADFAASATAIVDSLGLKSAKRTNSTTVIAYDRGSILATKTTVSVVPPDQNIYIGARDNAGTADSFDSRQIAFAFIGNSASLSIPNLYTRIQALMTSFGTNV